MEVSWGYNNPMTAGEAMSAIKGLRINLKFLPHDAQVLSGNVKIIVNDNNPATTKIFTIPRQTALNDVGSFGVWRGSKGFTLVTTNWQ
jgi:hypothetical protein